MSDASRAAPGFYPDPSGEPQLRWWSGQGWTADVRPPETGGRPVQPALPAGARINNVWVWLLAFSPLVSLSTIFLIDFDAYFRSTLTGDEAQAVSSLLSPGYLIGSALNWLLFAVTVLFAYLDWNSLKKVGVVQPFHWAWSFLSIVYVIGRAVVARRRTGTGLAPLLTYIAVYVAVLIVTSVWIGAEVANVLATTDLSSFGSVGAR